MSLPAKPGLWRMNEHPPYYESPLKIPGSAGIPARTLGRLGQVSGLRFMVAAKMGHAPREVIFHLGGAAQWHERLS